MAGETTRVTNPDGSIIGGAGGVVGDVNVTDRVARILGVVKGITDALPAGTNNIGDVDVLTLPLATDQNGIADTLIASGNSTAPAANAAIATLAAPGAGVYRVIATCILSSIDGTNYRNIELRHGATVVGRVLTYGTMIIPTVFDRVTILAAEAITLNATAAAGGGVEYVAHIAATRLA